MNDFENERHGTFFRFEELRIYHKSLDYICWVNQHQALADDKSQVLMDKFQTAAVNISINIAEGSARNKSQFIYYLKMAKSSIRECVVFTSIAFQLGYLSEEEEQESRNQLMEMTKMLGAFIGSLQRNQRDGDSLDD